MKRKEVSLCGPIDTRCPSVTISSRSISIGEKGNLAKLKRSEWNKLINLIKKGELKKV